VLDFWGSALNGDRLDQKIWEIGHLLIKDCVWIYFFEKIYFVCVSAMRVAIAVFEAVFAALLAMKVALFVAVAT
jgi:hypothetical protein